MSGKQSEDRNAICTIAEEVAVAAKRDP